MRQAACKHGREICLVCLTSSLWMVDAEDECASAALSAPGRGPAGCKHMQGCKHMGASKQAGKLHAIVKAKQ